MAGLPGTHHYNLPSHAQKLIEACHTRPDFFYEKDNVAIYVDGYHHLFPERQARDQAQQECMEDCGYTVIRFGLLDDWDQMVVEILQPFRCSKTIRMSVYAWSIIQDSLESLGYKEQSTR